MLLKRLKYRRKKCFSRKYTLPAKRKKKDILIILVSKYFIMYVIHVAIFQNKAVERDTLITDSLTHKIQ